MNERGLHRVFTMAVVALGILVGPNAWATANRTAELKQVSATAVVYRGPQIDVAMSYRFAKESLGDKWLMLDVNLNSNTGPLELKRAGIALRTPGGEIVTLASQRKFSQAYGSLAAANRRADIAGEPLDYLTPHRFRPLQMFAEPGTGITFDSVWLDERHDNAGRLFFDVPQGVQRGQYALLIDLPEGRVRIPFTI